MRKVGRESQNAHLLPVAVKASKTTLHPTEVAPRHKGIREPEGAGEIVGEWEEEGQQEGEGEEVGVNCS